MSTSQANQHDYEFTTLYGGLFEQIRKFADSRGIGRSRGLGATLRAEDPNDFAQECLFEYSESARRNTFQHVQSRLIWQIANHRLIDARRLRNRFPRRENFAVLSEAECYSRKSFSTSSSQSTARFSRAGLSAKVIDILRLKYIAGYSVAEIAGVMQMKPSGVNAAVARARKRLRAIELE